MNRDTTGDAENEWLIRMVKSHRPDRFAEEVPIEANPQARRLTPATKPHHVSRNC
jgi:hypothetical protein